MGAKWMKWGGLPMREANESRLIPFLLGVIVGLVAARVFDYLITLNMFR